MNNILITGATGFYRKRAAVNFKTGVSFKEVKK